MISVGKTFFWGALQYGYLVAGDVLPHSRILLNASSTPLITSQYTTVLTEGWPSHGPILPSTISTNTILTSTGQSALNGVSASSSGGASTLSRSFSMLPVGISVATPTSTEPSLPWTGRVLTMSDLKTSVSSIIALPETSTTPLILSATSSFPSTVSSPGKYANTTSTASPGLSTPQLASPTSINTLATGNLSISFVRTVVASSSILPNSATYTLFNNVSTCSTLTPGEAVTIWSIFPNTTTTTLTVTGNLSTSFTPLPEFTPPVYCPTFSPTAAKTSTDPASISGSSVPLLGSPLSPSKTTAYLTESVGLSSTLYIPGLTNTNSGRVTVTSITTSKNGITEVTSVTLPSYGGANGKTDKLTVNPSTVPSDSLQWSPQTEPPRSHPTSSALASNDPISSPPPADSSTINNPRPITTIFAGDPAATTPITEVVSGITVIADPSNAIIGTSTVKIGPIPQTVTVSGSTFTVLPHEIDGPAVVISIPTYATGGVFVKTPSPTTINGVSIGVGAGGGSSVVIGGTSYNIGPSAPEQTIVDNGQTIAVGSKGVVFGSTTISPAFFAITPPPNPGLAVATPATNIAIVDGSIITAVGASIAVIGGQTLTYGPNIPQTTTVFNGEVITLSPSGIIFHGSTIGGTALSPSSSQIGIVGGVSITEVGSTLAIVAGTTFTIGPQATPTSATINNQIVSAGPNGFSDGSFTWNPFSAATPTALAESANMDSPIQILSADGITFTELQSSLVVIGTRTFTFGPGAKSTTDVYSGRTISIGPSGIGFLSTTFTSLPTNTRSSSMVTDSAGFSSSGGAGKPQTTSRKNGGVRFGPEFGIFWICGLVVLGLGGLF